MRRTLRRWQRNARNMPLRDNTDSPGSISSEAVIAATSGYADCITAGVR